MKDHRFSFPFFSSILPIADRTESSPVQQLMRRNILCIESGASVAAKLKMKMRLICRFTVKLLFIYRVRLYDLTI